MFYIPNDLYLNLNNEETVHKILEKYYGTDVITDPNRETKCQNDLTEIGEHKILGKLSTILKNY